MENKSLEIKIDSNLDELQNLLKEAKEKADDLRKALEKIEEFQVKINV